MGISVEKGKFRARYWHKGKNHSVGMFDTELKAKRAITRYKKKLEDEAFDIYREDWRQEFDLLEERRTPTEKARDIARTSKSRITSIADKIRTWRKS